MPQSSDCVTFCIPLLPRAAASDWDIVISLLGDTLRSIANQSDRRHRVILAGHEQPDIPEGLDLDLTFVQAQWKVEVETERKLRDKRFKRQLLYKALRARGGGYAMLLDADDLVSARLVAHVLEDRHPNGYLISSGYAYDRSNDQLAPIPGAWGNTFDAVCGSCTVINFTVEDLTATDKSEPPSLAYRLRRHSEWKNVMAEAGRPLQELPFPGAAYVLNHSQNLHSSIKVGRVDSVPRKIAKHRIEITPELAAEFALPGRGGAAPAS